MNEINSIAEPEVVNPIDPRFLLGRGSIITAGHKIDFTDRVTIGRRSILVAAILRSGLITGNARDRSTLVRLLTSDPKFASRREGRCLRNVSSG